MFNSNRLSLAPVAGAFMALAMTAMPAAAQSYPSKPLTAIVTWPAGGGTDIATRTALKYVEQELGQRIDVRNIPGGGGAIGYVQGAAQRADGYNLTTLQFDILSVEAQKLAPVSHADFDTIGLFAEQPVVLAVKGDSEMRSLDDFIAAANARELKIGGASIGGVWHQASHLMSKALGVDYIYVPYEGITGVLPALLGGNIDAGVIFLSGTTGSLQSGDLRLIAVMAEERMIEYPDIPTFRELGHDVVYSGFYGMAAPRGTPPEMVATLADAFARACANDAYKAEASARELNPRCLGAEEFRTMLNDMFPLVESISAELLPR